jgi:hypothetical protein
MKILLTIIFDDFKIIIDLDKRRWRTVAFPLRLGKRSEMSIHQRVARLGSNQRNEKGGKFLLGQKLLSELLSAPCEKSPSWSGNCPDENQNTARRDQIIQDVLDVRKTRRNTIRSNIITNFLINNTYLLYLLIILFISTIIIKIT